MLITSDFKKHGFLRLDGVPESFIIYRKIVDNVHYDLFITIIAEAAQFIQLKRNGFLMDKQVMKSPQQLSSFLKDNNV